MAVAAVFEYLNLTLSLGTWYNGSFSLELKA